jgi:hypothetical protein
LAAEMDVGNEPGEDALAPTELFDVLLQAPPSKPSPTTSASSGRCEPLCM